MRRAAAAAVLLAAVAAAAAVHGAAGATPVLSKIASALHGHSHRTDAVNRALSALEGRIAIAATAADPQYGASGDHVRAWDSATGAMQHGKLRVQPEVADLVRAVLHRVKELEKLLAAAPKGSLDLRAQQDVIDRERALLAAFRDRVARVGTPVADEAGFWYAEDEMPYVEYALALAEGDTQKMAELRGSGALEKIATSNRSPLRHDVTMAERLLERALEVPTLTPLYHRLVSLLLLPQKDGRTRGRFADTLVGDQIDLIRRVAKRLLPTDRVSRHVFKAVALLSKPALRREHVLVPGPSLGKAPTRTRADLLAMSYHPRVPHTPMGTSTLPKYIMPSLTEKSLPFHPGWNSQQMAEQAKNDKLEHARRLEELYNKGQLAEGPKPWLKRTQA